MRCKIFRSRSMFALEEQVNKWLEENDITPGYLQFQFSSVGFETEYEYILECTLIIFYVPMWRLEKGDV